MPGGGYGYGPMSEADMPAVARLIHHAFAGPLDGAETWVRSAGIANMRVMRPSAGAPPHACLLRIEMGQYFAGRSTRMLGIAGVAVAPEVRGGGIAAIMMRACVAEAANDGFPISTLYPSTHALYRKVGYEQAGHRFCTTLPVGRIDVDGRGLPPVRALNAADDGAVKACYAKFAATFNGLLDRGEYCWGRVRELRGTKYAAFGVDDGRGGLDGYVYLTQERDAKTGFHNLALSDISFVTAAAGKRLLRFIADFATMADDVVLFGAPMHPLVSLMSTRHYKVEKKDYWMVRVLNVKHALEARGYAPAIKAECVLDIRDELVAANAGRWFVAITDGRANVSRLEVGESVRAGLPEIRCDVRAVAPLLSGLYSVQQMALMGWLEVDDSHAAKAMEGAFAASTPWMTEMF